MNHRKSSMGLAATAFSAAPLSAAPFAAAAALCSMALGCTLEDVNSDAIRTNGIFAEMLAIAPGNADTIVRANLTVGGASGTRVQLVGEDQLLAEAGDDSAVMLRRGGGRYEETLPGEWSREVTIRLERGGEDSTAQGSILLPEPFALRFETDVSNGVDRSTPVIVSWSEPGSADVNLDWSLEGDCIFPDSGTTPDDGVATLQPARLRVRPSQVGQECEVRYTLDRALESEVDPQFVPGSSIRAIQRRAVTFFSKPGVGEKNGPTSAPVEALD